MAKINNPVKSFQFNILIPGINPFLVQEANNPDIEFEMSEHGDTNYDVKTAGKFKVGMLKIQKIASSAGAALDIAIDAWVTEIQNGALPLQYKRPIIVEQLGNDGVSVVRRWTWEGCWPQKVNGLEFTRMKSENTIESIDFCVDKRI